VLTLNGCSDQNASKNQDSALPQKEGKFFYHLVTGQSGQKTSRNLWDKFYSKPGYVHGKRPNEFLRDNLNEINIGRALVLAMGEGQNAVYLAQKGFQVEGVDISEVALRKARRLARDQRVTIDTINANLKNFEIEIGVYDLIVNITYFRDSLIPKIKRGLKKGGVAMFENFTTEHLSNPDGLTIPRRFLVRHNQLKKIFSDFEIVKYQERNNGKLALASLIARKP